MSKVIHHEFPSCSLFLNFSVCVGIGGSSKARVLKSLESSLDLYDRARSLGLPSQRVRRRILNGASLCLLQLSVEPPPLGDLIKKLAKSQMFALMIQLELSGHCFISSSVQLRF